MPSAEPHDPHVAAGRMHRARGMLALAAIMVAVSTLAAIVILAGVKPRSIYLVNGVTQAGSTQIVWVPNNADAAQVPTPEGTRHDASTSGAPEAQPSAGTSKP